LIFVLLPSVVYVALSDPGSIVAHHEENFGHVVKTGRYRVIHERILGPDSYAAAPPDIQARAELHLNRHFIHGTHPSEVIAPGAEHYQYAGPMDGRRIYIYKRVHTSVRRTNGVMERLSLGQTVERWAEGGYKNSHTQNVHVFARHGNDVYSEDRVVPVKEG
ncbi:hypothetical protein PENTCL1PPCAC_14346, partial [Pristionchus entomophagus]